MAEPFVPYYGQGSRGDSVLAIQQALNVCILFNRKGRSPLSNLPLINPPTGFYGQQTYNTVRALQQWLGVAVDGLVGPKTLASWKRRLADLDLGNLTYLQRISENTVSTVRYAPSQTALLLLQGGGLPTTPSQGGGGTPTPVQVGGFNLPPYVLAVAVLVGGYFLMRYLRGRTAPEAPTVGVQT